MATKLYVGINGSGKSYEVVTGPILQGLRDGRRIVSNLAGLNYRGLTDIIVAEGVSADKIGTIFQVTHDQVLQDDFFRADTDEALGIETIIQPGDLVVLDEIWRFWESSGSVTNRQLNFFRMHRHMVNPITHLTCEVVLITQLVGDLQRKLRGVVEQTYAMKKHTDLGMDDRYRVDIYNRAPLDLDQPRPRSVPVNTLQRQYNPEYFKLYQSHSSNKDSVQAKEKSIDKRGNIFKKSILTLGIPLSIIFICLAGWYLYRFFHPSAIAGKSASVSGSSAGVPASGSAAVSPAVNMSGSAVHPASSVDVKQVDFSDDYRVLGYYQVNNNTVFALKRSSNSSIRYYRFDHPVVTSSTIEIKLPNSSNISTFTGSVDRQSQALGVMPR